MVGLSSKKYCMFWSKVTSFNCHNSNIQKQPSRVVFRKRCSANMQQIYRRIPMPKCDFNKVALKLYRNHIPAWVFSCKFAAYFSGHLFLRRPLDDCFWASEKNNHSLNLFVSNVDVHFQVFNSTIHDDCHCFKFLYNWWKFLNCRNKIIHSRGVFRTLSHIYDGVFL